MLSFEVVCDRKDMCDITLILVVDLGSFRRNGLD